MPHQGVIMLRAGMKLFSGSLVGKLAGALREMLLAYLFGTSGIVAAIRAAQSATLVPVNFFTADSLSAGFLPLYSRNLQNTPSRAVALFWWVAGLLMVMSLLTVMILYAGAPYKGVLTGPDQLHISYVHSPIRYAWDMQHQYLTESNLTKGPKSWLARWLLHKVRLWDSRTPNGVDKFLSNSAFIARRVRKAYGRSSQVLFPPVDTERFTLREKKSDFYLTASRLVPYKRIDLIVEAFSRMPGRRLIVVGDGPDRRKIERVAGANVEVMGYLPDDKLKELMADAKAFVFAAEEDFGIIPVEAQACGTPVIAYGKGGVLETVVCDGDAPTGVFFREQTVESLCAAVEDFERRSADRWPASCRRNAERFSVRRFRDELRAIVDECLASRA